MFSKTKKSKGIDSEQREQYEYARRRVIQKKNLMHHFIFFLAGSILFIVLDILKVGEDLLGQNWYFWAILVWAFFLLIHVLNVFLLNSFMGKEWENRQLEKLKAKQAERIAELEKKVEKDLKSPKEPKESQKTDPINNPLPPELK